MFVNRSRLLAAIKCDYTRRHPRKSDSYYPNLAVDELIELINRYTYIYTYIHIHIYVYMSIKISFFVNINLNKSYCKNCIIYMAHTHRAWSLSFFLHSCFLCPILLHQPRVANTYIHYDATRTRALFPSASSPIYFIIRRRSACDRRPESASRFAITNGSVI